MGRLKNKNTNIRYDTIIFVKDNSTMNKLIEIKLIIKRIIPMLNIPNIKFFNLFLFIVNFLKEFNSILLFIVHKL